MFGHAGPSGGPRTLHGDTNPLAQLRARYEWQIQSKDQKLQDLQNRLSREEVERMQMQAEFDRDREGLVKQLNQLVDAVEKYGIHVDLGVDQGRSLSKNELDSKMEQLNNLLHDR